MLVLLNAVIVIHNLDAWLVTQDTILKMLIHVNLVSLCMHSVQNVMQILIRFLLLLLVMEYVLNVMKLMDFTLFQIWGKLKLVPIFLIVLLVDVTLMDVNYVKLGFNLMEV